MQQLTLRIGNYLTPSHLARQLTKKPPGFDVEFMRCVAQIMHRRPVFLPMADNSSFDSIMEDLPRDLYDTTIPRYTAAEYRLARVDAITSVVIENKLAFVFGPQALLPVSQFNWYNVFHLDAWLCILAVMLCLHLCSCRNRVWTPWLASMNIWLSLMTCLMQTFILSQFIERPDLPFHGWAECAISVKEGRAAPLLLHGTSIGQRFIGSGMQNATIAYARTEDEIATRLIRNSSLFNMNGETLVADLIRRNPRLIRSEKLYSVGISYVTCLVKKQSPLKTNLSKAANRMREVGLTGFLRNRYYPHKPTVLSQKTIHPVRINSAYTVFITVLVGLTCTLFPFLLECRSHRRRYVIDATKLYEDRKDNESKGSTKMTKDQLASNSLEMTQKPVARSFKTSTPYHENG